MVVVWVQGRCARKSVCPPSMQARETHKGRVIAGARSLNESRASSDQAVVYCTSLAACFILPITNKLAVQRENLLYGVFRSQNPCPLYTTMLR